ncbi:MAG TPA: hypothetical protein VI299_15120, partial [Polyangiales bacterium]
DGKCKMNDADKRVMAVLYRHVRLLPVQRLSRDLHALVELAHERDDDSLKERIYAQRVLAETMISRPVMKRFKARIRREGLFALVPEPPDEELA